MSSMSSETRNAPRPLTIGLVVLVVVATGASLFFVFDRLMNRSSTVDTGAAIVDSGSVFDGSTAIEPPRELPDFTLTSHTGDPIQLSDLRGKVTLMYFGYTHCPDFCPNTLNTFTRVKAALGADADQVNFVLLSVDGARDTPEVMNAYLSQFDSSFIGMTGTEDAVEQIGTDYGLHVERLAGSSAEEYLVDHASNVYLIDPEGRLTTMYMYATEPDVIAEDVRAVLS
jgi:protein SCO1/2